MSNFNLNVHGRADKVAPHVAEQLAAWKTEDAAEAAIKAGLEAALKAGLAVFPADKAVQVTAGWNAVVTDPAKPDKVTRQLLVQVVSMASFLE